MILNRTGCFSHCQREEALRLFGGGLGVEGGMEEMERSEPGACQEFLRNTVGAWTLSCPGIVMGEMSFVKAVTLGSSREKNLRTSTQFAGSYQRGQKGRGRGKWPG